MSLEPGARLGPYRIIAPIGAGGMGEVWKAHDEKLDRDVALKVLPARLAAEPEALARFEREARAVAALSHPNIMAIHDFGQDGGRHYAVMELLEGQTLRETLDGGPLSPKKAVEFGRQIAEGLAAAHAKGIVHRDLKPENLFVTRDGHVKILDFGLARQNTALRGGATDSPTVARGTEPGTVMGTAGYMAPEQVRGEVADHRADIFAFGAVLYEMLTGRRAFERATGAETLTAILREDPVPLTTVRAAVPPGLERVVEHCLEKRPEDRFQSARDLAFDLGGSSSASGRSGIVVEARSQRRPGWASPAVAALVLGLAAGMLAGRQLVSRPSAPSPLEVRYLTYSGHDFSPAASADGRSVAFRSDRDGRARIWLKQLATGTEAPLTEGPMDDLPQFSPDGSTILFTRPRGTNAALFRVPLLGGEPRRLVDDATDGTWSPDGSRIAFLRLHPAAPGRIAAASLIVASSDGGSPRVVTRVEGAGIRVPRWSADGKKISMTVNGVGGGSFSLRVVDVENGASETVAAASVGNRPWGALWSPGGRLIYTSGQVAAGTLAGMTGRLMSLDPGTGRTSLLYASPDSLGRLAAIGDGSFVIESQSVRQNISEWPNAVGGRRVTQGRAADRQPVYSPDGQWIVFSSDRSGNLDLWAASTTSGELRQLTDDPADDWDPAFGPDGRLLWSSNRSGIFEIWKAESDGSGARQLTHDGTDAENPAASPDGQWIVYGSTRPGEGGVWRARADGSAASLLVAGLNGIPEVSRDGRYILYLGFAGNLQRSGVKIARLDNGEPVPFEVPVEKIRSTTANMGRARWTPDGRSIAFIGQDDKGANGVFVQDFLTGRDTSATRRKVAGFDPDAEAETFGISPDGHRIAIASREMVSSLVLLQGLEGFARAPR